MQPVGITSSLAIPRHRLSASSSRVGFEPDKARLHGDGAWSPGDDSNPNDFVQVDLQYEVFICAVATQGYSRTLRRFWTTKYRLLFSVDGTDWLTYKENGTDKVGICYEFECFKWQVVCSPVRTQGCRKQQQGYLFHSNAIIPHETSQQHTLGF